MSALTSLLAFIVAISVLVAVHEFGHYIVGRWCGMKVLRFSIGFGKPIWMRVGGKDRTEYCISAIPLGGYVKFLGERYGEGDPVDPADAAERAKCTCVEAASLERRAHAPSRRDAAALEHPLKQESHGDQRYQFPRFVVED